MFNLIIIILFILNPSEHGNEKKASRERHTLRSGFTGQNYELSVLLPVNYNPDKTYPILYLMDAFLHFNTIVSLINESSKLRKNVILVGIYYKDYPFNISNALKLAELRKNDFTYPADNTISDETESKGGGALLFYRSLKEELIPLIEKNYHSKAGQRTILGHSLGAYFALFQFLKYKNESLFSKVIALSPSVYWAKLAMLRLIDRNEIQDINRNYNIYLGIGAEEGVQNNVLFNTLTTRLQKQEQPKLVLKAERYTGGHIHSTSLGFKKALTYFFSHESE